MVEPLDITPRYLVFSSLVQVVYPQFLVGTSVFQYVIAKKTFFSSFFISPNPPQTLQTLTP